MNAMNMAKTAYTTMQTPIRTPRGIEYDAFARITHSLKASAEKGRLGFGQLAHALHQNRKLWTLLASDVAGNDNGLSPEIRARIFYLSEFTNDYSRQVLSNGADVSVLVEINTAIMRGLRQKAETA